MKMDNITDAAIAYTHWEACKTCIHAGDNGCELPEMEMHIYLGDWIICENYGKNLTQHPADLSGTSQDNKTK